MNAMKQASAAGTEPFLLVGCGILHREVDALIARNGWRLETRYLASALHNYLDRLSSKLQASLEAAPHPGQGCIVLYGACHPLMDRILVQHGTLRTKGQNCIVQLIGYERFMEELGEGAYFLLEDWAITWEPMITAAFGKNLAVVREIFHSSHKRIVAIRTPCSGDFTAAAESAARFVDLPLTWMDADLSHLEAVLADAIDRKRRQMEG